jgi:hypothetical protein
MAMLERLRLWLVVVLVLEFLRCGLRPRTRRRTRTMFRVGGGIRWLQVN